MVLGAASRISAPFSERLVFLNVTFVKADPQRVKYSCPARGGKYEIAKRKSIMSAPDTNIERQERNHKPALIGIKGSMIFGALMLIAAIVYALSNGSSPSDASMSHGPAERLAAEQGSAFDLSQPDTHQSV
jgi:hypothetical protein